MKKISTTSIMVWVTVLFVLGVAAIMFLTKGSYEAKVGEYLEKRITILDSLFSDKDLLAAVIKANQERKDVKEEKIKTMDRKWIEAHVRDPFIKEFLNSKISLMLNDFIKLNPEFKEVFITDKYGCIVALSNKTSDFYQADELWWVKAQESAYVGEVEYDDSAQTWSYPIYRQLLDANGKLIGIVKAVVDIKAVR